MGLPSIRRKRVRAAKIPLPDALGGEQTVGIPAKTGSVVRQLAQELSLAALIGGNLFGRLAMGPALAQITDKAERGRVLNLSWRRYGTVNSLALAVLVAGWVLDRKKLTARRLGSVDRTLVLTKDIAVGAVVLSGLASAAGGVGFAHEAPHGAVPMDTGHDPAAEAPSRAARLKHLVNLLGALNLGSEVALVVVDTALRQRRTRRLLIKR